MLFSLISVNDVLTWTGAATAIGSTLWVWWREEIRKDVAAARVAADLVTAAAKIAADKVLSDARIEVNRECLFLRPDGMAYCRWHQTVPTPPSLSSDAVPAPVDKPTNV